MNTDRITTGTPIMTYDEWQRFSTDILTDGTIREYYGKVNGITGDVKVIEYKKYITNKFIRTTKMYN